MPGHESMRNGRDAATQSEKNYMYLVELCQAVGCYKEIVVSDHIFVPREFLAHYLERNLLNMLTQYLKVPMDFEGQAQDFLPHPQQFNPRRPSDMLIFLNAQMAVLQNLDTCCMKFLSI